MINISKYNPYLYKSGKSSRINLGNNAGIIRTPLSKFLIDGYTPTHWFKHKCKKIGKIFYYIKNHKEISKNYNKFMQIREDSTEYMQVLSELSKKEAKGKKVEINLENGQLSDIVKSDESCIFVINHDNAKEDPALLGFFNMLLSREYVLNNKGQTCPRPKIIMTDSILKNLDSKTKAIMEKFGYVGIDSRIFTPNSAENKKVLSPVLRDFIKDKVNIFIFPEGRMMKFSALSIEQKFQPGISKIIEIASMSKNRTKVVPLGFSQDNNLDSIYIGAPLYFKKKGKEMLISNANSASAFSSKQYSEFFKGTKEQEFKTITKEGKPVIGKDVLDYISGVLCENIKICREEAKQSLRRQVPENEIIKL